MRRHWKSLIASLIPFCAATVFVLSICPPCQGQTSDATLGGVIEDRSGAVIPHVAVKVTSVETGVTRNATTNGSGLFSVPGLNPGQYSVHVEHPGFADVEVKDITLNVGSNRQLEIKLPVGQSSQTVTVDGSGPTINTTDASVSTVIDRQFVENIPLNGRSFQPLILLTPGVATQSPQNSSQHSGYNGEFSVDGQRTESNVYTVDGVTANTGGYVFGYGTSGTSGSLPAATALGTTQSLVSVDALQEFRVASSSYSAEYGLSPGGQFTFTTRSGTNQIHGVAFDYLRNNYFDANDWFNDNLGKPATALRQNDFGGTFSGPVRIPKLYNGSDKSFFFFSYEGLRLVQPQAAVTKYVPSIALRQAAPAALQAVLNAYPVPVLPAMSNGLAPFVQADSVPSSIDSTGVRFDQQITSRLKVFYRFSDAQSTTQSRTLANLENTSQSIYTHTFGATATLSRAINNDFRLGYTSSTGANSYVLDNFGGAQPASLFQLQGVPGPNAEVEFGLEFPGYSGVYVQIAATQPQRAWDIVDGMTIAHGRQAIKLGGEFRRITSYLQRPTPDIYSFFNSAQAILTNNSYTAGAGTYGASYPAYTNTALYFQDDIRVRPDLSLALGTRWEVNPPPTQTRGTLPYIAQGDLNNLSTLSLAPADTRFWRTTYFNFAPRLGVAYHAHAQPGLDTIVRAGGGVFFDSGQQLSTGAFGNSPGQSSGTTYTNVSYPLTAAQINVPLVNPPLPPYHTVFYFPTKLQLPYTLQWNLSVEQALGKTQAVTLSYVGSNGRRLQAEQQITSAPNISTLDVETSSATSSYNALQVKFQRTISRGLQMLASYTWAHSIDFGSQNLLFSQIRGNSDFDLRQSFNLATSYDIHSSISGRFARSIAEGWGVDGRLSARTAFPVTLQGNTITESDGQLGYSGLNVVLGNPVYLRVPGIAGNRQINPAAFALPAPGQNGDAPRNFVRGFGVNQIDFAVRRSFPLTDRLNLDFRAEAFNILNHPNFGYIVPTYGNVQFGEATEMLDQSLGNLSPLYQQGGPRSMQFAFKLRF